MLTMSVHRILTERGGFWFEFISVPVFGKTRLGKPMILVGKHKFWATQSSKNGRRWLCSKKTCKATFLTKNDVIVRTIGEHNHD
ncbi:hypothetical protein HF086_014299 [Spodoptera exigua]|uniref:FLYWCH-type domain-containing protein n=1 Tax=Spodoptera exigua TaxID=7107 RepID=A0A922M784_SPOEX|nr:hypothetical protein HF086_014299 [Spodoptera exigua]